MADRLDQLEQEVVVKFLKDWVGVYDLGQQAYDSFSAELRAWIDEHGHRVESFVPVVAFMQPEARVICRALVEDALAATLSQGVDSVDPAVEHSIARVESRGVEQVGGVDERVAALEERLEVLEREHRQLLANTAAAGAALVTFAAVVEPEPGSS